MLKYALLVTLCLLLEAASGKREWAVLVCGSRGYWNYRHHADVCHAYQTIRRRGIPDSRIITMMYDDVAMSNRNPFRGKIFNRPTSNADPVDVNADCLKDYTGEDVTPENFLNILTGNQDAMRGIGSGKVLNSTEEDDVFINFVDHGAPGLVAFPSGELYAKDLLEALETMYNKKMYNNLVFYMEACESGSMFAKLPTDRNVYAVTAANGHESSWATYCPPSDDLVNGMHLGTCLGDEFSVHWLEDTDGEKADASETLFEQFKRVKKLTSKSHVMDFGDVTSIPKNDISDFLGDADENEDHPLAKVLQEQVDVHPARLVDSRDVTLVSKFYQYLRTPSVQTDTELREELEHRRFVDNLVERIARATLASESQVQLAMERKIPSEPQEWTCHKTANTAFKKMCLNGSWTDYSLKYSASLLSICETLSNSGNPTSQVLAAIAGECSNFAEAQ